MAKTHVIINSSNTKLRSGGKAGLGMDENGKPIKETDPTKIISSTSRTSDTCPVTCPFKGTGVNHKASEGGTMCYPTSRGRGGVSIFDQAEKSGIENTGDALAQLRVAPPGSMVRHLVSGDVAGSNDDYIKQVNELAEKRPDLKQFGYTHDQANIDPKSVTGMTLNASTETPKQAEDALKKGWQVVIESPAGESYAGQKIGGRRVVSCPNQKNENIGCANCGICQKDTPNRPIVEFEIHGNTTLVGNAVRKVRADEQAAVTASSSPDGDSTDKDSSVNLGMPEMPTRRDGFKSGFSDRG